MTASASFLEKLEARIALTDSLLCVGLDPDDLADCDAPCDAAFTLCKNLIEATLPFTCCYKPNIAFFEALGADGLTVLQRICQELIVPHQVPILLDVKRGDIGNTAQAYATACYEHLPADAVTLSPLMGWDSIEPFVTQKFSHKGAFLLCKTSNPGSNDILSLPLSAFCSTTPTQQKKEELLYERIASITGRTWSARTTATLGLVVGATDATALRQVRSLAGEDLWILAPGVGAQGGNLRDACMAGMNAQGSGLLIPVSRGISAAADPRQAAQELCAMIQALRAERQALASDSTASTVPLAAAAPKDVVHAPTVDAVQKHVLQAYQKEFIEFSLQQNVLKFGTFTLKSGRTSPYFFNAGLFASGYALYMLGQAYASAIMSSLKLSNGTDAAHFDVLFGPAYKGISLGAIVSSALYSGYGINVDFAYNRKEVKDHGEGGQLVGASLAQRRVLIIDDVITAGTAIRESYDLLTSVAAIPMGVVIALDRAEVRSLEDPISAVQAVERDLALPVVSIVNLVELQSFLEERSSDYDDQTLQSVVHYRKEYGAM